MPNIVPYSNFHELNLDWILTKLKELEDRVAGITGAADPSNDPPEMDGTADPGNSANYSRGNHVHPTDTSRASQADMRALQNEVYDNYEALSGDINTLEAKIAFSAAAPLMDSSSASSGSSPYQARADHVHPTDTSRASASDLEYLRGRVDAMSGAADPATNDPLMDGTATPGASNSYARGDHRHPTDTSRASAADLTALQQQVNTISGATPSNAAPVMDGTAAAGSSALYARGDHVHPTDTSRASVTALTALSQAIASKSNILVVETLNFGNVWSTSDTFRVSINAYKEGYTFLGFLGYQITNSANNGQGASTCHVYEMTYNNSNNVAQIAMAQSGSEVNINVTAQALYVANS